MIMINATLRFGDRIYAKDSLYFFLGKRAIKKIMKEPTSGINIDKWEGLVLVCDPKSEALITTFKNKNWLKKIRYK